MQYENLGTSNTPEYKEYLTNQLKMAQIDLLSKLQTTQVDRNLRQTCRYNKEKGHSICHMSPMKTDRSCLLLKLSNVPKSSQVNKKKALV
jgi:hypothetical protein